MLREQSHWLLDQQRPISLCHWVMMWLNYLQVMLIVTTPLKYIIILTNCMCIQKCAGDDLVTFAFISLRVKVFSHRDVQHHLHISCIRPQLKAAVQCVSCVCCSLLHQCVLPLSEEIYRWSLTPESFSFIKAVCLFFCHNICFESPVLQNEPCIILQCFVNNYIYFKCKADYIFWIKSSCFNIL